MNLALAPPLDEAVVHDGTYHLSALSDGCLFVQLKFMLIFFAGRFNTIDKTYIFIIHFLIAKKHSLKVTTAPCSYSIYMFRELEQLLVVYQLVVT